MTIISSPHNIKLTSDCTLQAVDCLQCDTTYYFHDMFTIDHNSDTGICVYVGVIFCFLKGRSFHINLSIK